MSTAPLPRGLSRQERRAGRKQQRLEAGKHMAGKDGGGTFVPVEQYRQTKQQLREVGILYRCERDEHYQSKKVWPRTRPNHARILAISPLH